MPGVAVEYPEVERIHKGPPSDKPKQRLFGDLAYRNGELMSANPKKDLDRLIANFRTRSAGRLDPRVRALPRLCLHYL